MTADTGEEGKNGKINFYPVHLDSKSIHLGSSPDGEVFQSTPKGVPIAQNYRGSASVRLSD